MFSNKLDQILASENSIILDVYTYIALDIEYSSLSGMKRGYIIKSDILITDNSNNTSMPDKLNLYIATKTN